MMTSYVLYMHNDRIGDSNGRFPLIVQVQVLLGSPDSFARCSDGDRRRRMWLPCVVADL